MVAPHPDDELEGWSQVERSASVHTVWLVMTHGEGTAYCDPGAHARNSSPELGEIPPRPVPQGSRTPSCGAARLASWTTFLALADVPDRAAATPPDLPASATAPTAQRIHLEGAGEALLWASPERTLVAVDGGDGRLRVEAVRAAVRVVLASRPVARPAGEPMGAPSLVPDLPLERVVAAAYVNSGTDALDGSGDPNPWAVYAHPDHVAVHEALLDRDLARELAPRSGVLVATWPSDPAAGVTTEIPTAEYERLMGLGPLADPGDPASARREGLMQRVYGWLGNPRGHWPPTELPVPDENGAALVMARVQTFVRL